MIWKNDATRRAWQICSGDAITYCKTLKLANDASELEALGSKLFSLKGIDWAQVFDAYVEFWRRK